MAATSPKPSARRSPFRLRAARFGKEYQGLANVIAAVATLGGLVLVAIQLWQINHQLKQVEQSNSQAAMATVYSEQNEVSRFVAANHFVRDYFYKDDLNEHETERNQRLRESFKKETAETQAKILMVAEITANCFECVYQMQASLPKDDWNAWWISFQDSYDESPILQDYFSRRNTWYSVDNYLRIHDPVARDKALKR